MTRTRTSPLSNLPEGVIDLHEIAVRQKYSRLELARWASRPRCAAQLSELAALADRRTRLLLATGRAEAALVLVNIARGQLTETKEIVRRACMDLLKLDGTQTTVHPSLASPVAALPIEPTATEMIAANEAIARYTEQRQRDEDASGAD